MANIKTRRTKAGIRYDVGWRLPDGTKRKRTFARRKDADSYVKKLGGDELAGLVVDPNAGEVSFGEYADEWIRTRLVKGRPLSPATRQGYEALLRRNLKPTLKDTPLRKITPETVRRWHSALIDGAGQDQAAKSYRLLRAILSTAVEDMRIGRNPCQIRGAGTEQAPERPMIAVATILELADAVTPRLRALVILAGFGGLRTGEMLALTRADIDSLHKTVRVRAGAQEITGSGRVVGDPKSEAGKRIVTIPQVVVEALEAHLGTYAQAGPDGVVFTAERGQPLRRAELSEEWRKAVAAVKGAPEGLHVHDCRHAAAMMARMPGVTTKELMARLGHASPRAALIYQHATEDRDQAIAAYLDQEIESAKRAAAGGSTATVTPIRRQ